MRRTTDSSELLTAAMPLNSSAFMTRNRKDETTLALPSSAPTLPLLTMQQVMAATTFSRPSIYRLLSQGKFPAPLKLGRNRIGFVASEVDEWIAARPRAGGIAPEWAL